MCSMSNRITEKLLFSPTNIPGCTLWLDAADPNTVVGTSPVTNWKDKSGKGYNLSSSGGTPQYVNYGPGYSIYLNNSYLAVPTIAGGVNLANYSFFIVSLSQTAVTNQTAFSSSTAGVYNYASPYDISFFIDSDSGSQRTRFYSNGQLVLNSIPTTTIAQPLNLMSYTGNSAGAFSSWVNGNTGTTNTSGARASGTTSFSAGGNWTQTAWATYANTVCNLYEVVVYTTVLTTAQRQQVEGYLTWKWGLQGSLPSNHPYKNLAPSYPLNSATTTTQGTFSPTSISGLTAWFDGSDPAGTGTPPANGASISTWVDKSGSGHNAVAGGAPTFAAASLNGLGTLTFNGTTNYLYASGLTVPTNTHSLFAVHNPVVIYTPSGTACLTGILRAQETIGYIVFPYGGGLNPGYGYTTSYIPGYFGLGFENDVAGSWNLYETVVGSSAVTQYQYGTVVTANTGLSITATTSDNFTVGSYSSFGGSAQQFYYGSMAELLVFNVELSTTDRQKIEGYLAWKWGKQASLSPSNPYYSAPPTSSTSTTVNVPWIMYRPILSVTNAYTPLQISGCQLWLASSDITTLFQNTAGTTPVTAAGQQVQFWADKSGNGRNATSSDTAMTYNTTGIGKPSIYFAGGQATGFQVNVPLTNATYFFVVNNASPNDVRVYNSHNGTSHLKQNWWYNTYRTQMDYAGITGLQGPSNTSGVTLVMTRQDTSSSGLLAGWQTGTSIGTVTVAVAIGETFTSFVLGTDNGGLPMIGYIAEVIVYNSVLGTSDRQSVEGYLAWKFGVQANLPPSHPYYSAAPSGITTTAAYSSIPNSISVKSFSPLNITGLQLWLDGQDRSSMSFSGSTITSWRDKSGNNNNGTATGAPVLSNVSGYQQVYLNGSSWFLGNVSVSGTAYTTFAIVNYAAQPTSPNARIVSLSSPGNADYSAPSALPLFVWNTTVVAYPNIGSYIGGNNPYTVVSLSTTFIATSIYGSGALSIYVNGGLRSSVATSFSLSISTYGIGQYASSWGNEPYTGNVGEVLIYNRQLTTAQREQVEGYLAWKWGLQGSLPSNSIYKNYPPPP